MISNQQIDEIDKIAIVFLLNNDLINKDIVLFFENFK